MVRSPSVAAAFAVLLLCLSGLSRGAERLGARECEELGFTGLALCSDCNALAEFVKDQELVDDCRKCCTEDSDDSISKLVYSGAIIEVCMRKLVFYPEVVGFLEEDKDAFPYVESRIDNWKREHIRQFLTEKREYMLFEDTCEYLFFDKGRCFGASATTWDI
uniref:Selenoprotein F n=1 Tax=Aegilops tauschii TaxID=37682 RepID=N1QXK8_AEGTA